MNGGVTISWEESVRAQLERILASSEFAASERMRRFLRFVVEAELETVPAKAAWPLSICERAATPPGAKSRSRAHG